MNNFKKNWQPNSLNTPLRGSCPVPPPPLALFIIVQAYTGLSDDQGLEPIVIDRRSHLVLDCIDCEQPPFAKGTLLRFRAPFIPSGSDRRLVERTIELASKTKGYNSKSLRAALDSSPLWRAARVEDTYHLLGHALKKTLEIIAKKSHKDLEKLAQEAGAEIVANSSRKAALDLDWDDPSSRVEALTTILQVLNQVEAWIAEQSNLDRSTTELVEKSLKDARIIEALLCRNGRRWQPKAWSWRGSQPPDCHSRRQSCVMEEKAVHNGLMVINFMFSKI